MAAMSLFNHDRLINRICMLEAFSHGRLLKLYKCCYDD
jgi:hypothetical protein